MIKYWTLWNFILFTLYFFNYLNISILFLCSIYISSIVGFTLINIYPCSRKFYIEDYEIEIPWLICFIGDLINHQLPCLYIFFIQKEQNNIKSFGEELIFILILYHIINYYRKLDIKKIYNVDNSLFYSYIIILLIIFLLFTLNIDE